MVVASVSTTILASVILVAITVIIVSMASKWRNSRAGKTLPGPPRWPLIGNTFLFTMKVEDLVNEFTPLFDSYPGLYHFGIGPSVTVAINDPVFSKAVLADHKLIHRSYVEMLYKDILGMGLITSQSVIWRLHRKIMGPAFTSMFLQHFIDIFNTQSKIMVEQLEVHEDGPEFDMEHHIASCIFDMVNEATMNVKLGTQINQDHEFKRAMDSIIEISSIRVFRPWLHPEFFFHFSPLGAQHAKHVNDARGFARRIIKNQIKEMTDQHVRPEVVDLEERAGTPSVQRRTLLDLLMHWNNGEVKLQDEDIIDELITVAIAATDTTAIVTNMLMLALACNPDVQEKVYEEVIEVCGEDNGQTITVNQLNNLVYLERVIKETLRLFPVVGILPRDAVDDMKIGDYFVPKGAVVVITTFALHKNEKFWPDPLKFDPNRFSPEEVEKRHPYAYMPFGSGPRNCIGHSWIIWSIVSLPLDESEFWKPRTHVSDHLFHNPKSPNFTVLSAKFAMMTIKMMCARVVRKYALEQDHPKSIADVKMKFGITMKPCEPVTVRIRRRQANIANSCRKSRNQESAHRT